MNSSKRRRIETSEIQLKYGIEIECVFKLINDENSIYKMFIILFEKSLIPDNYYNTIKNAINLITNNIIEIIIDNEIAISNIIYKTLLEIHDSNNETYEDYYTYFISNQDLLSNYEYFKNIFDIAIDISPNFKESIVPYIYKLIDYVSDNKMEPYIFTKLYNLDDSKIKLSILSDKQAIQEFYEKSNDSSDNINMILIRDTSVECDKCLTYKDIKSGIGTNESIDIINECEFITQVFNNISEIKTKLSNFFDDSKINNYILNCFRTSQHVHISFNQYGNNIRPDIKILISIIYICYFFQKDIFSLFLKTRSINKYCIKLNYQPGDMVFFDEDYYDIKPEDYNHNIMLILELFYNMNNMSIEYLRDKRYYWLNIINLYTNIDEPTLRPYTIEFRIKHGSADANELSNICKLYENIIKYGIELSKIVTGEKNIVKIIDIIDTHIKSNDITIIFKDIILKDIYEYFKDATSEYVIGLKRLNDMIPRDELKLLKTGIREIVKGGSQFSLKVENKKNASKSMSMSLSMLKSISISNRLEKYYKKLEDKSIYKLNPFGLEYIGNGLASNIINHLETKFKSQKMIKDNEIKAYLETLNVLYD